VQRICLPPKSGQLAANGLSPFMIDRWREQIGEYRAGYSSTAAPLIVKDMVVTGNAGGEWGVVGRVEARDARTGRPTGRGRWLKDSWVRCVARNPR
jgi:hypothetical protein